MTVANQLRELVLEGDQTGSGEGVQQRIELVVAVSRDIRQARARQEQAAEHGLPLAPAVRDEQEGREALRSQVMMLSVAAAEWVAAMDFAARRSALTLTNGQARRRPTDEEPI